MAEQFEFDFGDDDLRRARRAVPPSGTVGFTPGQARPQAPVSRAGRASRFALRNLARPTVGGIAASLLPSDFIAPTVAASLPGAIGKAVGRVAGPTAAALQPNLNIASGEFGSPEHRALVAEQGLSLGGLEEDLAQRAAAGVPFTEEGPTLLPPSIGTGELDLDRAKRQGQLPPDTGLAPELPGRAVPGQLNVPEVGDTGFGATVTGPPGAPVTRFADDTGQFLEIEGQRRGGGTFSALTGPSGAAVDEFATPQERRAGIAANVAAFDRQREAIRSLRDLRRGLRGEVGSAGRPAQAPSQFVQEREARNARVTLNQALQEANRPGLTRSQRSAAVKGALAQAKAATPRAADAGLEALTKRIRAREAKARKGEKLTSKQQFDAMMDLLGADRDERKFAETQRKNLAAEQAAAAGLTQKEFARQQKRLRDIAEPGDIGVRALARGAVGEPEAQVSQAALIEQLRRGADPDLFREPGAFKLPAFASEDVGEALVQGGFAPSRTTFLERLLPGGTEGSGRGLIPFVPGVLDPTTLFDPGRILRSPGGTINLEELSPQEREAILASIERAQTRRQ